MQNIKQMDQTHWVCYKFGENSYYYGEVGLLDHSGVVHPKDNAQIATNPKNKLVKHGFGIYIYNDNSGEARYEGNWSKDLKSGKGLLKLKNGDVYEGGFKDGCYHDNGIFKWKNGDIYDGRWKKGRMEGPGFLKRHDGLVLKGSFKNNYFLDLNTLRNPFMSNQQYEDLKKRRKQLTKQQEKNQKAKNGFFTRTQLASEQFTNLISKSNANNRVPLIISSQESHTTLTSLKQKLLHVFSNVHAIDLRKFYKLDQENKYAYLQQIQKMSQISLKDGGILLLSLDDGQITQFEQLFYPQIREIYTTNGFSSVFWAPVDLNKSEIKNKIIGNAAINDKFRFAVWSKLRLPTKHTNDSLRQKIQKIFETVLPYIKIDNIFIEKQDKNQAPSN